MLPTWQAHTYPMYTPIHTYTLHAHTNMHMHTHTPWKHKHTHKHVHTCTHACTNVRRYTHSPRVCKHVYTCSQCVYTHMHTCTYTHTLVAVTTNLGLRHAPRFPATPSFCSAYMRPVGYGQSRQPSANPTQLSMALAPEGKPVTAQQDDKEKVGTCVRCPKTKWNWEQSHIRGGQFWGEDCPRALSPPPTTSAGSGLHSQSQLRPRIREAELAEKAYPGCSQGMKQRMLQRNTHQLSPKGPQSLWDLAGAVGTEGPPLEQRPFGPTHPARFPHWVTGQQCVRAAGPQP